MNKKRIINAVKKRIILNNESISFKSAYESWILSISNNSKPNTLSKYRGAYKNHLSQLDECPIEEIDSKTISELTAYMISQKLSNKTINDILIVLNMVLKYCTDEYGIKTPQINYLKEVKSEMRVLCNV